MAVLKRPKTLTVLVLEYIKSWLIDILSDDSSEDNLEELHLLLPPWLTAALAESLLELIMDDQESRIQQDYYFAELFLVLRPHGTLRFLPPGRVTQIQVRQASSFCLQSEAGFFVENQQS
jgi:hypothetical protein